MMNRVGIIPKHFDLLIMGEVWNDFGEEFAVQSFTVNWP